MSFIKKNQPRSSIPPANGAPRPSVLPIHEDPITPSQSPVPRQSRTDTPGRTDGSVEVIGTGQIDLVEEPQNVSQASPSVSPVVRDFDLTNLADVADPANPRNSDRDALTTRSRPLSDPSASQNGTMGWPPASPVMGPPQRFGRSSRRDTDAEPDSPFLRTRIGPDPFDGEPPRFEEPLDAERPSGSAPDSMPQRRSGNRAPLFGVVAIAALAAIGSLLAVKRCSHAPAVAPVERCDSPKVCMVKPVPAVMGDKKCDVNQGERDPISLTYDGAACGYCGETDDQGKPVVRPWMTDHEGSCDFAFACGNGKLDKNTLYAGFMVNAKGKLVPTVLSVSESCNTKDANYCEADCPKSAPASSGAARPKAASNPEAAPKATGEASQAGCPREQVSTWTAERCACIQGRPAQERWGPRPG